VDEVAHPAAFSELRLARKPHRGDPRILQPRPRPHANWIFGGIGIAALTGISLLWRKDAFPDKISKTAAALLVSGIFGNLTDRILPGRGYVVDFLDFQPPFYELIDESGHFPSFNVADSCICVAAGLLILSAFRQPGERKRKAST